MAIVNTGRLKIVEVLPGQVWKDRDKRCPARRVRVESIGTTRIVVRNTGSKRLAQIYLQDFVARFDLEAGT